jgi:predicted nucleotidyltransferase
MTPSTALAAHRSEIRDIVLAHRAVNASVFGSVVHGLDTDESDLDILKDTTDNTTLFDLGAIRYKLRHLLGVLVDVLTPEALPEKFRHIVIAEARPI